MTNINLPTIYPLLILIYFNARIIYGFFSVYKLNLKKDFMPRIVAIGFFLGYSAFLNSAIYQFNGFLSANLSYIYSALISFIVLETGFRVTKYMVLKNIGNKKIDTKFSYFCEALIYPSGSVILLVIIILTLLTFF